MARPRLKISEKQFESLCGLQCTKQEISDFFKCDEDTIQNWCKRTYNTNFSVIYKQKRGIGRVSLRRSQWRLAEKSTAMAIFLGKNYLEQSDKIEYTNNEKKIEEYKNIFNQE